MCLRFAEGKWEVATEASKATDPKSLVSDKWGWVVSGLGTKWGGVVLYLCIHMFVLG